MFLHARFSSKLWTWVSQYGSLYMWGYAALAHHHHCRAHEISAQWIRKHTRVGQTARYRFTLMEGNTKKSCTDHFFAFYEWNNIWRNSGRLKFQLASDDIAKRSTKFPLVYRWREINAKEGWGGPKKLREFVLVSVADDIVSHVKRRAKKRKKRATLARLAEEIWITLVHSPNVKMRKNGSQWLVAMFPKWNFSLSSNKLNNTRQKLHCKAANENNLSFDSNEKIPAVFYALRSRRLICQGGWECNREKETKMPTGWVEITQKTYRIHQVFSVEEKFTYSGKE